MSDLAAKATSDGTHDHRADPLRDIKNLRWSDDSTPTATPTPTP